MRASPCQFLIVGAGLAGAATAWHLRRLGAEGVVLLEQEAVPGVHSSGRNAAIVRERMDHPALAELARESSAVLRSGALAEFRPTGGVLLDGGTADAAAHLPPALGRGSFEPGDGVVDVAGLLHRFLEGQDVRYGVRCLSATPHEGGLHVETDAGDFSARVLINAGGPWAGALGELPLTPRKRHLFVSAYDAEVDPAWPFLWDLEHGYYLRPESGGWLLCACDEAEGSPGSYDEDPEVLERLGALVRKHQPGLGDLRIARQWVGQRTFAQDGLPVVGFDPRDPARFHVAGLGGHGVTLAYALGRVAAEALVHGTPVPAALDPAREALGLSPLPA